MKKKYYHWNPHRGVWNRHGTDSLSISKPKLLFKQRNWQKRIFIILDWIAMMVARLAWTHPQNLNYMSATANCSFKVWVLFQKKYQSVSLSGTERFGRVYRMSGSFKQHIKRDSFGAKYFSLLSGTGSMASILFKFSALSMKKNTRICCCTSIRSTYYTVPHNLNP